MGGGIRTTPPPSAMETKPSVATIKSTPWVSPDQTYDSTEVKESEPSRNEGDTSAQEWRGGLPQRSSRSGGKKVDPGSGVDKKERRAQEAELSKGPLMTRKMATRALIWSAVLQTYEVLSNMLSLPGWAWGVAGFAVTAPEVWSRGKDAFKSWRGKQ